MEWTSELLNIWQMSKETQKGEEITGHRWSRHLASSPLAILCHVIHMIILEKSVKQWDFFLKTLGLDFSFH